MACREKENKKKKMEEMNYMCVVKKNRNSNACFYNVRRIIIPAKN